MCLETLLGEKCAESLCSLALKLDEDLSNTCVYMLVCVCVCVCTHTDPLSDECVRGWISYNRDVLALKTWHPLGLRMDS